MRFTLHYSGPLQANGKPDHKHALRRAFHLQLVELWNHEPLRHARGYHRAKDDPTRKNWEVVSSLRRCGPFNFVPIATNELKLVAALDVLLLRPEPPGQLITRGGDIDNRIKTLFDALSMPQPGALPAGVAPAVDEDPFFCVLEDDNLVTSVTVHTEHLLLPNADRSHVELVLRVHLSSTSPTMANEIIG